MTYEELKEKIVEAINGWIETDAYIHDLYDVEDLAATLIAAGLRFDATESHTATFNNEQLERLNALEQENTELKAQIATMIKPECAIGDTLYTVTFGLSDGYKDNGEPVRFIGYSVRETVVTEKNIFLLHDLICKGQALRNREDAQSYCDEMNAITHEGEDSE